MATGKAGPGGFTYLGLLLFIAIGGIGLAVVGRVWHTESQREREKELLFIGEQYAKAIGSYYENTPDGPRQYPAALHDLLRDGRFPTIKRHLRKHYRDPITGSDEWGLTLEQGRIVGVYSLSQAKPIKQGGFADDFETFAKAASYRGWQFTHRMAAVTAQPAVANDQPLTAAVTQTATPTPVTSSAVPTTAPLTSDKKADPRTCQAAWTEENAQCRGSCGSPAGLVCRSCFATSFSNYRSCLHGG